jgi:hypothetical protein
MIICILFYLLNINFLIITKPFQVIHKQMGKFIRMMMNLIKHFGNYRS